MSGDRYSREVEQAMRSLFGSLSERDRRLYAATEAVKLGHGGIAYLAAVLGCSERTIRRGMGELAGLPVPPERVRRKGGAESAA